MILFSFIPVVQEWSIALLQNVLLFSSQDSTRVHRYAVENIHISKRYAHKALSLSISLH